jgi:hypothetical protein
MFISIHFYFLDQSKAVASIEVQLFGHATAFCASEMQSTAILLMTTYVALARSSLVTRRPDLQYYYSITTFYINFGYYI